MEVAAKPTVTIPLLIFGATAIVLTVTVAKIGNQIFFVAYFLLLKSIYTSPPDYQWQQPNPCTGYCKAHAVVR
jgi:hypothetical protein